MAQRQIGNYRLDSLLGISRPLAPSGPPLPTRRALLAGAGATCAAALTGCAAHDASGAGSGPATSSAPPANALTTTSRVPDGGGTIIPVKNVVITQPQPGSFKAFTAICTHQGCIVSRVSNGTIDCPCHGSKYSIENGSVVHGPATRPLAPVAITVDGSWILQASPADS